MSQRNHFPDAKESKSTSTTGDILQGLGEVDLRNDPPPSLRLKRCLTASYQDVNGHLCQVYDERSLTLEEIVAQRDAIATSRSIDVVRRAAAMNSASSVSSTLFQATPAPSTSSTASTNTGNSVDPQTRNNGKSL